MEKGLLLLILINTALNSMLLTVVISYFKIDAVEVRRHNKEKK